MNKATRRLASILETHCRYAGRSISPGELVQAASTADPAAPHKRIRDLETELAIIGVLTRGTRTPEGMIYFNASEATSYKLDQHVLRRLLEAPPDQDLDDGTLEGYLSAGEVLKVLPDQFNCYNALKRYCEKNDIPTCKPAGQRLLIHAAKLLSSLVSDNAENDELIGVVERYTQHREKKDRLTGK